MTGTPDRIVVGCVNTADGGHCYVRRDTDGAAEIVIAAARPNSAVLAAKQAKALAELLTGTAEPSPPSPPTASPRRRAKVLDLIEGGLLQPGEVLSFERGRTTHEAIVHADGRLETTDGAVHNAPSPAAMSATGATSENGWVAWRVPDGRSLDDLLWELRAETFPQDGDEDAETRRSVVRQWVMFARGRGLSPGKPRPGAVDAFLNGLPYMPDAIEACRACLDEWFAVHGRSRRPRGPVGGP